MIVEISAPQGAGTATFGQVLAERLGDCDFSADPMADVAVKLMSSQKARTQAVSFIRTMPALNRYRSLGGR